MLDDWAMYASVPVVATAASGLTYLANEMGLPSGWSRRFVILLSMGLLTAATGFLTEWSIPAMFVSFFFTGPTAGLAAISAYDGIKHGADAVVLSADLYYGYDGDEQ